MKFTGNRPLSNASLWSIRSVIAFEPFVSMSIEPGGEFGWMTTYEYYTFRRKPGEARESGEARGSEVS